MQFIPHHEILFLDLKSTEPEKLVICNHPFGWLLRVIQKEQGKTEQFENELRLAIEHLEKMSITEQSNWEKLMYFLLAFISRRRNETEHGKLLSIIKTNIIDKSRKEVIEEMGKTMAQVWIEQGMQRGMQQGMQQGLQQGLQQGKKEGLYEAISLGLELKYGTNGLALMEKILKIESVGKLEVIKEAVKIAKSMEEVEKLIGL